MPRNPRRKISSRIQFKQLWLNKNKYIEYVLNFVILFSVFLGILVFSARNIYSDRITRDSNAVEQTPYAIVFGSSLENEANVSRLLERRAEATAELYRNGKIRRIYVAGSSSDAASREIDIIRESLLSNDVPDFVIQDTRDAFTTYEVCLKAKSEANINQAILVTNSFHMSRALYLCNSLAIDSVGLVVQERSFANALPVNVKENLAMVKAILDVNIIRPGR